jgi:hypothetical protein
VGFPTCLYFIDNIFSQYLTSAEFCRQFIASFPRS